MKPIELKIYHHTDETTKAKEMAMDYNIKDCELRKITFYHIDAVCTFIDDEDDGVVYGSVLSAGSEFISNMTYEQLNAYIQKHG